MSSTPQSASTSADVPFHGLVETTGDALRLIQAARQGIIPRITRRLNEDERGRVVCSGAVFIFSVQESGIRRWTEGLSWSASRIAGNFLVSDCSVTVLVDLLNDTLISQLYRELTSRNNGRTSYTGKALSVESAFSRRRLVTPRDQDHQPTFKTDGLIKKVKN
jgi:Gti1/Pac2 family